MPTPATMSCPSCRHPLHGVFQVLFLNPLAPAALATWLLFLLLGALVNSAQPLFDEIGIEKTAWMLPYWLSQWFAAHPLLGLMSLWLGCVLWHAHFEPRHWRYLHRWFPLLFFCWLYLFAMFPVSIYLMANSYCTCGR